MVWNVIIYWFIGILIVFSDATNETIPYLDDDGKANVKEALEFHSLLAYQPDLTSKFTEENEFAYAICPDGYKLCKRSTYWYSRCVKTENSEVEIAETNTNPDNLFLAVGSYHKCRKIPTIDPDIFDLFAVNPTLESNLKSSNHDGIRCAVIDSSGDKSQTRYFTPKKDDTYNGIPVFNYEAAKRIQKSGDWRSAEVNPRSQIQYHVFCGEKEDIQTAVESWYKKSKRQAEQGTKSYYDLYFLGILVLFCYGGCVYSAKCVDDEDTTDIQQQQQKNVISRAQYIKVNANQSDKIKKVYIRTINYSDLECTSEETTEEKQYQFSSSAFVMNIEDLIKLQNEQNEPDQLLNFSDLEYTSEKTVLEQNLH